MGSQDGLRDSGDVRLGSLEADADAGRAVAAPTARVRAAASRCTAVYRVIELPNTDTNNPPSANKFAFLSRQTTTSPDILLY